MPELLRATVKRLRAVRPDVLVCTGDLLDYPLDRMTDSDTLTLGSRDLELVHGILSGLPCPAIVLPGNHDPVDATLRAFGTPPEATVGNHRFLTFLDQEDESNVPRRRGAEIQRFQAALADDETLPQVHVQHYVIWPEPQQSDYPYCYAQAESLCRQAVASGAVRLVLSGHYHPGLEPRLLGGTWFATAPAYCEAPHPVWLYEVEGRVLRWRALQAA